MFRNCLTLQYTGIACIAVYAMLIILSGSATTTTSITSILFCYLASFFSGFTWGWTSFPQNRM